MLSEAFIVKSRCDDWLAFAEEELSAAGVPNFGLHDAFTAANQDRSLKFAHDNHWNAAGHRFVAGQLEAFLLENEILP